jgi:HK97 family phage portal protein
MAISGEVIEKSQVTVTPPGLPVRFALLGGHKSGELLTFTKQSQYGIYYEMYRQHPIVRGGIEKISKYAVATGFHFEAEDPIEDLNDRKHKELKRFFRRSNAVHLLRLTYKDLLIYGEAFWVVEKSLLGTPMRALRLHPKFMSPELSDDDQILQWVYGPGPDAKPKKYRPEQVLHFRFDDPDNDIAGLSLLHSLQLTVTSDLNAIHFNGNFFENSAQTGLIIILKTSTAEEAKRNREWLDQHYVGPSNAHRPMLLEGDVDVKQGVGRMADMQYIEGRKLNRQEIMTVLDIPPDKLNIVEDFRRQPDGGDRSFQSETIAPLQAIVEEEINNNLILMIFRWDDIIFRHNAVDDRSELDQAKLYAEYERIGVMSVNQIAKRLGLPPVKGGDSHYIQTAAGLIPVHLIDEVAERLIISGQPDPVSGLGTDNFGQRNPPKRTGAEESKLDD